MKSFLIRFALFSLVIVSFVLQSTIVHSQTFTIDDIRIEGLQRVSADTVFASLPIKVDTDVSQSDIQEAVRELFKTGFFAEIDIARDGNLLIVTVLERPAINRIGIVGNSILDTESLLGALKGIGLFEGNIFKQSALNTIERELNAQYSAVGRYATEITVRVQELQQNQVNLAIRIIEGEVATIKQVNIVGNKQFSDEDIQALLEVKVTGRWSFITGSDKYEKQKLAGDLEKIRAFYFDQGYLEFDNLSTQVSLSPDKKSVFITINIFEGDVYTVNSVKFAGDPIISLEELSSLVTVKEGDTFSQKELLTSSDAIKRRLGNDGYSFSDVRGTPELDKDNKTAAVTFLVNPGNIYYVRRIVIRGNTTTQDNVLRREMRQIEGAPASTDNIERSRLRLQQLPLFSDVNMSTVEVPGQPDQIDVIFTVVEQPSGSINASLGYSQGSGITLGAGLQQSNWLGTGNTFGFQVNKSQVETGYSVNFTNPYFTPEGVSRGVSLFYRETDLDELDISRYSTDRIGLNLDFGYPISETSRIKLGVGVEKISVTAGSRASQEISGSPRLRSTVDNVYVDNSDLAAIQGLGFQDSNANEFLDENDSVGGISASSLPNADGTVTDSQLIATPQGFLDKNGNDFDTINLNLGWSDSTLNKGIFPTKGGSQSLDVKFSIPLGDLEFYKITYSGQWYRKLTKNYTLRLKGKLGYADSYGKFDNLPFFENFFAGGSSSVRGFEQSTLGPKGTPATSYQAVPYNNAGAVGFAYLNTNNADGPLSTYTESDVLTIGGNMLFETGIEVVAPVPFAKNIKSLRSVLFVDAGSVFSDDCVSTQAYCSDFDLSQLSSSIGVGLQWLSPIGPLSIYFSKSIQEHKP